MLHISFHRPDLYLGYDFLIPSSTVEPETPILAILFVGHRNWGSQHRKIYEYSALSWPCYVKQQDK